MLKEVWTNVYGKCGLIFQEVWTNDYGSVD